MLFYCKVKLMPPIVSCQSSIPLLMVEVEDDENKGHVFILGCWPRTVYLSLWQWRRCCCCCCWRGCCCKPAPSAHTNAACVVVFVDLHILYDIRGWLHQYLVIKLVTLDHYIHIRNQPAVVRGKGKNFDRWKCISSHANGVAQQPLAASAWNFVQPFLVSAGWILQLT